MCICNTFFSYSAPSKLSANDLLKWSHTLQQVLSSLSPAPTGPPQSVTATATASTIAVQWDEVDCIKQNSEITGYKVWYGQVSTGERKMVLVPASNRSFLITELIPFNNYSIEVAAVNNASQVGPSETITVETLQDSELTAGHNYACFIK